MLSSEKIKTLKGNLELTQGAFMITNDKEIVALFTPLLQSLDALADDRRKKEQAREQEANPKASTKAS